jgi:transcriptional regulator with XRE-family HTH domain
LAKTSPWEGRRMMEELLTTEELAERLRVNPSTIRRWRLDDVVLPISV